MGGIRSAAVCVGLALFVACGRQLDDADDDDDLTPFEDGGGDALGGRDAQPGDGGLVTNGDATTSDSGQPALCPPRQSDGPFIAFVTSNAFPGNQAQAGPSSGWTRLDGQPLFAGAKPMGVPANPLDVTEQCTVLSSSETAWTGVGTTSGGAGGDCDYWRSDLQSGYFGLPSATDETWATTGSRPIARRRATSTASSPSSDPAVELRLDCGWPIAAVAVVSQCDS
jgi:hypothetical protein